MKNIIKIIDGMPVEIPVLDEQGEKQRQNLAQLAFKEYESSGSLTSPKLQEANSEFLAAVKDHNDDIENGGIENADRENLDRENIDKKNADKENVDINNNDIDHNGN